MKRFVIFTLTLIGLLSSVKESRGQIIINDCTRLAKLKKSVTYFIYEGDEQEFKPYRDAIESIWTISAIKFIHWAAIDSVVADNVFFIQMCNRSFDSKSSGRQEGNITYYSVNTINIPTFTLWFPSDFKKDQKNKTTYVINDVAYIDLSQNYFEGGGSNFCNSYFLMTERYHNTKPGYVKNQLQYLQAVLLLGKEINMNKDLIDINELHKLKNDTLFVPKYVLKGITYKITNTNSGQEIEIVEDKRTMTELFKHYNYQYKSISDKKLNSKILECQEPFYYLLFLRSYSFRHVCIFNAKTGQIIYSHSNKTNPFRKRNQSLTLMDKDIKRLMKTIK